MTPTQTKNYFDGLFTFERGINYGVSPLLLERNQLAFATNATVRGTLARPRPTFRKIELDFQGDSNVEGAVKYGLWQACCIYQPDNGDEFLVAAIAGRLYSFSVNNYGTAVVADITGAAGANPADKPQAWLWQSEKWLIWTDGQSLPVFYDGTNTVRSNYGAPINFSTTIAVAFAVPAVGATALGVNLTSTADLVVGDIITIQSRGSFQVLAIPAPNTADILNIDATPEGFEVAAGTVVSWTHIGTQLPPGRMGVYGMGRNWMCLADGKQFLASDIVGGSSGTVANNYRDAVLEITENLYLAGGGNFTVPGQFGEIRAMRFTAVLDAALGQGALQIFTPSSAFSCNAPVDRLTWQDLKNPILTQSLISVGALGHHSTINVNSDIFFRSTIGIGSLVIGQRDFSTWGNVPLSNEVSPLLDQDNPDLLQYSSAIYFDNRMLMTVAPVTTIHGVYHQGMVALNFDAVSSIAGKTTPAYDGFWTGLNVLQMVSGLFNNRDRAFAFGLNVYNNELELYEIQNTDDAYYDNGDTPILWTLETPAIFKDNGKTIFDAVRLVDGELHVQDIRGTVYFSVLYKPDQYPCWIPWHNWAVCAPEPAEQNLYYQYQVIEDDTKPQYRVRMGLGEPNPRECDDTTNKPLREGYTFQVKIAVRGHCKITGMKFKAIAIPTPQFAKPICEPICSYAESEEA